MIISNFPDYAPLPKTETKRLKPLLFQIYKDFSDGF